MVRFVSLPWRNHVGAACSAYIGIKLRMDGLKKEIRGMITTLCLPENDPFCASCFVQNGQDCCDAPLDGPETVQILLRIPSHRNSTILNLMPMGAACSAYRMS